MEKKNTAKVVYQVGTLSTESYKVALSASHNLSKEVSTSFFNSVVSISQFCNWLYLQDSESAKFVKEFVLHLSSDCKKEEVFTSFKSLFPYKNENGKLVTKKVLCKGLQTIEEISLFSESVLNTLIERSYFQNKKPISLPLYFTIERKGKEEKVISITESDAKEILSSSVTAKEEKKNQLLESANKNERITKEVLSLVGEISSLNLEKVTKSQLLEILTKVVNITK